MHLLEMSLSTNLRPWIWDRNYCLNATPLTLYCVDRLINASHSFCNVHLNISFFNPKIMHRHIWRKYRSIKEIWMQSVVWRFIKLYVPNCKRMTLSSCESPSFIDLTLKQVHMTAWYLKCHSLNDISLCPTLTINSNLGHGHKYETWIIQIH